VLGIAMFPFLAVLICTMGALIVLLILVVHQARVQADTTLDQRHQTQAGPGTARQQELEEEVEDLQWQREVLQQQRSELTQKLADGRLELSHLEEHIRRLEANWQRLQAEAAEQENARRGQHQQESSIRRELAQLQAAIASERQQLEQLRERSAKQRRSFAILPYQGPHGTRRRPIYIECSATGIVLQPENIVFDPRDFGGPLGPGNPLDAALRAIREHWTRLERDVENGEPYPLLIVRPNGAVAYAMARAAMAGWDDEFGYELIDGETELAFPPSDPSLKRLLQSTIQTARERQAILAAAMPSRFDMPPPADFSAPPGEAWGSLDQQETPGSGGGFASGGSASDRATRGNAAAAEYGGGAGRERQPAAQPAAAPAANQSPPAAGTPPGPNNPLRAGNPAGQADGTQPAGGDAHAGAGMAGAGGAAPQAMSLAKGPNWALRNSTPTATGITRPVTIHCYPDRLVIVPDRRSNREPQTVFLKNPTRDSIEEFVAAIWTHVETWGMAVSGGYWKPTLKVTVFPGAETRFWELQALLAGSGLDVQRR